MDSVELTPSVSAFLSDETDDARRKICQELLHGDLDLLKLTLSLQPWLTNSDHEKRSLGCRLLSGVVIGAPEALVGGKADVMAEFLGARLSDWPCSEHAAIACLSLINNGTGIISLETGVGILRKFALTVQVPPMARPERQHLLALWLALVQKYGPAALTPPPVPSSSSSPLPRLDLVDVSLAAIEGEKDPRCLLLAFQILEQVSRLYHSPKVDPAPLQSRAEEVIDTLSCYWPIKFTPPKNDPHGITRHMLEDGIEACMASSPFLATFALPLILEKLSSTLRTAKHDALSALSLCCAAYGRDVLTRLPPDSDQHASSHSPYGHSSPHDKKATLLSRVWSGLRSELLSPCDPEIFSTTGALGAVSEELSSRLETAGHAYSCLSSCLDSLGDALIPLVVQDGSIGGWMKNALEDRSESQGGKGSPSASARFSCVASILSAVSSTSPEGLGAISSQFLPLVLNSISPSALLSTRVDESLASPMRGLQFIGLMTKNLSSCNGNKLESMRAGLQDLICRTSQALDVFGGQLDQAMQPIPDTDGDLLSFEAILQEATLIYCFAWSNLLSLADRLFPSKSSDEGQNAPRDLLPPSVAHRLTTRLAKWALSPPQSSSPVSVSPDPKLFVSFGSLVPPLDPKIHSKGLPSDLVRSQAAAIASPPSALPLQQAALDALLALLSSSLSLGGGCLTLTDRVLDQVISLLVNSASSANQDWAHRSRSHLLMAASALSHDARLPDLGWALMGRWRDLALGPLSLNHPGLNATDGQDTLMTSGETGAATHQLGLSRELLQCMASSILPGLLSSLPSNVATIDEWKLKSAASFALSLLDSLSSLDVSSAPAGIKEIFLVAASFVGQCVAIAGRSASPAEVLGTLAIKAIQGITKPMTLHSEHFLLSPSLCAIITSLPPSLLSSFLMDPDLKSNLLTQLVKPALEASGSLPAAVALASLVIKSPDSEIGSLSSFIVESFQSLSNKDGLGFSAEAWRALSWLCRALVMRKHEASLLLIDLAISTIFSQDNSNNQLGSTKEASALMFRLLVSEASPHTQENEDIQSREIREEEMAMQMLSPYGRPLWRQRAFDLSLGRLEKAQNSNLSTDQCYISLALCHLIGACAKSQPRLLMGSASIAGRSLTLSLQYLTTPSNSQESPSSLSDALTGALDALDALLGINEEITQTSNAPSPWPEASPHLPSLLAALTCLVAFNGSSRVREKALKLLTCIMLSVNEQGKDSIVSYHILHPHRLTVIKAVKSALDDPKRSVRKAAILCNKVWAVKP